jgi:hypothetical protein
VRTLTLPVGGVLGSDDAETGFSPVVRQLVGVIHAEIQRAHRGSGAAVSLGQVDGEVATPVRESVCLVMVRGLETEAPVVVTERSTSPTVKIGSEPTAVQPPWAATCRARRAFSQSRQR